MTFLNQQLTHGQAHCHISIDRSGKLVFVSQYGSGSLAVLPISDTQLLYVSDLGTDKVPIYRIDKQQGTFTPAPTTPPYRRLIWFRSPFVSRSS